MFKLLVVRVPTDGRLGESGVGRDKEKALSHAGWTDVPADADFQTVHIGVTLSDYRGARGARLDCGLHIEAAEVVPLHVKDRLSILLSPGEFPNAVRDCSTLVWDRRFEQDRPPGQRSHLFETNG